MLVQRLDGTVAVVVCNGESQHVTVCPVDGPESVVEVGVTGCHATISFLFKLLLPVNLLLAVQALSIVLENRTQTGGIRVYI